MKLPPPPRWVELSHPLSADVAPFVIAGCTPDFRCRGAVFVGPFAAAQAASAWARLERDYHYSGATFFVFGRLVPGRVDLELLRRGAVEVMQARTIFSTEPPITLERYFVVRRTGEGLELDAEQRLPERPSAAAAARAAAALGADAEVLVALRSVAWHVHM